MYLTASPASSRRNVFGHAVNAMWPTSQPFCRGQIWAWTSSPQRAPILCNWQRPLCYHMFFPSPTHMLMDGCERMEMCSVSRYPSFPLDPLVDGTDLLRLCWQILHSHQWHLTAMENEFLHSTQHLWDLEASPLKGDRNSVFPLTKQEERAPWGNGITMEFYSEFSWCNLRTVLMTSLQFIAKLTSLLNIQLGWPLYRWVHWSAGN